MTLSYLNVQASVILDLNGNGLAMVKPATGQYWLPTLAHVGTADVSSPTAACSLHIGVPGALDFTTQIDFTFAGVNDTSGLVSSHIIEPGEGITAQFLGGNPGDTAILTVVGVSSDVPPTIGVVPSFPGTEFSGAGKTVSVSGNVDVIINDKRQYPNSFAFFDTTVLTTAASVIVAAVAGVQIFLHTVFVSINPTTQTDEFIRLQTTAGNTVVPFVENWIGAASTAWNPIIPPVDMKGLPLPSGVGLQLTNTGAASVNVSGVVSYSV